MGLVLGLLSNLESRQLQLIQAYDVIEGTLSLLLSCNPPLPQLCLTEAPSHLLA